MIEVRRRGAKNEGRGGAHENTRYAAIMQFGLETVKQGKDERQLCEDFGVSQEQKL